MGSDLYVALSGALARLRELEVTANNLANADTVGFKRDRTSFVSALESALTSPDGKLTPGAAAKVYTALGSEEFDASSGPIDTTGAPLDVAIQGPGYFVIETADGPRYTRAGAFRIDTEGRLSTPDGQPVAGDGGPIQVGAGSARISSSGDVLVESGAAGEPPASVGTLRLVEFDEGVRLEKHGRSLFRAPDDVIPRDVEDAALVSGALERSNVQSVQEIANLVIVQRAFDVAMQVLEADDEASKKLIQEVSS